MKALTLWQPWASLLACGAKIYETRSWATSYRGPIAIHAAKKSPISALRHVGVIAIKAMMRALGFSEHSQLVDTLENLDRGCIIATAALVGCHRIDGCRDNGELVLNTSTWNGQSVQRRIKGNELLWGDWTPGRYAWEFANMTMLPEPIPARGGQRIWNWMEPNQ